jgi:hypothetical protein
MPLLREDPSIQAAIGHDLSVSFRYHKVQQHPVVVSGVPHPLMDKDIDRSVSSATPLNNVTQSRRTLDDDPNLTGVSTLGLTHRIRNRLRRSFI